MALGQLLDQIREYYVGRFIDAINEHSAGADSAIAHESAFCNSDGIEVTEGQLGPPARGDLFIIRDGEVVDSLLIDTEGMLTFDPIAFKWPDNSLDVELGPFQWNWIQLRIHGLSSNPDFSPLREWFMRWFQDGDPADGELLGGVHFMSDPEVADGYTQLSIDLGSAPVESFEELLHAVGRMRPKRLTIGQFSESK